MSYSYSNIPMTSMCQGSKLLGMSKDDERTLESYLRKMVKNNGTDFVIAKLKTLKLHTIRQIEDPLYRLPKLFSKGDASIAWRRDMDMPRGPLSTIYRTWKKPSSRIRGIGMLINSITNDEITPKQMKKFADGINHNGRDADNFYLPQSPGDADAFINAFDDESKKIDPPDGTILTADLIPHLNHSVKINKYKEDLVSTDDSRRHAAFAELSSVFDQQLTDTPLFVIQGAQRMFPKFRKKKLKNNSFGIFFKNKDNPSQDLYQGRSGDPVAGNLSILQKPGGKLRTVFNTNRVINWAMTPYAKALDKAYYKRYPEHIFVERQDKGLQSIQQMIRRGKSLVSADLSSATDRLNFRLFTNGLRTAIVRRYCTKSSLQKFYNEKDPVINIDRSQQLIDLQETDILKNMGLLDPTSNKGRLRDDFEKCYNALDGINQFERVASLPFYSPDFDMKVALRTGQPLGMMGSFQTLTAMNFSMGRFAEMSSNKENFFSREIPQFAVVGDDFVGDKSIMSLYSKTVSYARGKDNHEKSLKSDHAAEFLSHLITRDKIISMKPKFQIGKHAVLLNAQKTSVTKVMHAYRLDKATRDDLITLARCGDPVESEMTTPSTSSRLSKDKRMIIQSTLSRLGLNENSSRDNIKISPETVELSRDEMETKGRQYRRKYFYTDNGLKESTRPMDGQEIDQYSPVTTKFNHHTNSREKTQSLKEADDSLRIKADTERKIIDVIDNGNEHMINLPYHKNKRPLTDYVLDGIDAAERAVQGGELKTRRDLAFFPKSDALKGKHSQFGDTNNQIDRGKAFKKNATSKYVSFVGKPDPTMIYGMLVQHRNQSSDHSYVLGADPDNIRMHSMRKTVSQKLHFDIDTVSHSRNLAINDFLNKVINKDKLHACDRALDKMINDIGNKGNDERRSSLVAKDKVPPSLTDIIVDIAKKIKYSRVLYNSFNNLAVDSKNVYMPLSKLSQGASDNRAVPHRHMTSTNDLDLG